MHDADLYATLQYSIRNYVCSACSRASKGATKKGGGSEPDFSPPPPQSKKINFP